MNLLELSEMENPDEELVPEILPVDARLSIEGAASSLEKILQSALEIVPSKEVIPNTSYVELSAHASTSSTVSYVKATATDGERTISMLDDAISVRLAGSALIPGRRVQSILKLLGGSRIRLDIIGTTAIIRAGRAVWNVTTPPANSALPEFSDASDISLYGVSTKDLLRALLVVYPAVAKTSARQSLMQARVGEGSVISCDGVRAHKSPIPGIPDTLRTTLPLRFIESAIKELRATDQETVEFGSDSKTVVLNFGRNSLISQRLNYEYPDVERLFLAPALTNEDTLRIDVAELKATVKRVRVNSDPDYFSIILALRKQGQQWTITVQSRDANKNSSSETIPAVGFEGREEPRDIVVNHKYLLDLLDCLEGEIDFKIGETSKKKQSPVYVDTELFTGSLMQMALNFVK